MADPQTRSYLLLLVGWISLYLSQRTVPSTTSHLQTGAAFSVEDVGSLLSCFAVSYALTKLASGFLYDSLGLSPKLLFCWGLGAGGFLCLLFPATAKTSISLACLLWLVVGVFQGLGWPACAQMTKQWYKSSQLGKRYLILSASSNVAAAIIPILSAYMATAVGWESIYYLLGTICILFTPFLVMGIKYHPQKGDEKKDESFNNGSTIHEEVKERTEKYPWYGVFLFKEFWLVTVLNATAWTVKASVIDWMQLYLIQHMDHPQTIAAQCTSVSEVGGLLGKLLFAVSSDYLISKKLLIRRGLCPRAPVLLVLALLLSLSTHLYSYHVPQYSTTLWLMVVLFGFGFSAGGMVGMCSLSLMESVPPPLSATSLGIGDCLTHLVGRSLLGYTVFSYVVNHSDWGWSSAYRLTGTLALTSTATALLLVLSPHSTTHSQFHHKNKHH
jgi:sugar phosphate permease